MRRTFVLFFALTLLLSLSVPAAAALGYIKAKGDPGSAGLFVDGNYMGPAVRYTFAVKYAVEEGEHDVLLQDPRCEDFRTTVTVKAGEVTEVNYRLKRLELAKPPLGTLRFGRGKSETFMSMVVSDTSAVYINGKFYGHVDELNHVGTGLLLPPGTYEVRVSSPMHGNINQKVTIEANRTTTIKLPR